MVSKSICPFAQAMLMLFVFGQPLAACAAMVDFNHLAEGSLGLSGYTDPATGALFLRRSVAPLFTTSLVAEFVGADASRPKTSPGIILSGNGFSPGDGFGVSPKVEIEVLLPKPSMHLTFDMVSLNAFMYEMRVLGYTPTGRLSARRLIPVGPSSFDEFTIHAPFDEPISRFVIRPVANTSQAYDNFRFTPVPEPSTAMLAAVVLGCVMTARNCTGRSKR